MSGLAAIFHLDGQTVRKGRLQAMVTAMPHRGPDGCHTHLIGQAGLGYLAMHTTPESIEETQPWSDESGEIWVVFDGRLDNRAELEALVRARGVEIRNPSDVELVLRAFQILGPGFAKRLLGDFAILIWDALSRRLIGARDIVAERPFYYSQVGRTIFVASEIRALLTQPEISTEPNTGMVAEHLADRVLSTDETLYRSIRKLPPAHLLLASSEGITVERYWEIDPAKEVRYRSNDEYAAHFRDLFEQAVDCRLRSIGPVAVDLSGGLDSSSITSMIEDLRRRGKAPPKGVEFISMVFPNQPCDESRWISAVVDRLGIRSTRVEPTCLESARCRQQAEFYRDLPDYPNGTMADGLRLVARNRGCRVRLTGLGGDEWLAGSPRHTTDHIRRLQLIRLVRQLAADRSLLESSFFGHLRRSVAPLFPAQLRYTIHTVLRRNSVPKWLGPALRDDPEIINRLNPPAGSSRYRSYAQADLASLLDDGFAIHRAEMEERAAAAFGLDLREPFNDRRIVEFGLAIPEEQRWLGRDRKLVLRHAMADLLPDELQNRSDKAEFSSVVLDALRCADPDIFLSPRCAGPGWVDTSQVAKMYEDFRAQADRQTVQTHPDLWPLWKILGIEIWYQVGYNEASGDSRT
jgi:asparagine synthase (glutamine-hydrolysing)